MAKNNELLPGAWASNLMPAFSKLSPEIKAMYSTFLAAWQQYPDILGPLPDAWAFNLMHAFNKRPGPECFACVMYLREGGATNQQVMLVTPRGTKQRNYMFHAKTGMVAAGYFQRNYRPPQGIQGHEVSQVTLTPKGAAAIKARTGLDFSAHVPGAPKPEKAAKPRKAKASKPKPAAPAVEVEPVIEPAVTEPVAA